MRFRTYPKIGPAAASIGGPWIATEKIHGANFVIGLDLAADVVTFGKRKAWLEPDEPFFGWQLIARDLALGVRAIGAAIRTAGTGQLVCFGELFGGGYPHPDVPAIPGLTPVQTGIWYAPDLRWSCFDILVAGDDDDDGEILAFTDTLAVCAEAEIVTPPVIARGRFSDADRWPVEALTDVPLLFDLPPIANNRREGFVAKPDRRLPYDERPILKRKLPEFDDAQFDGAEAWDPGHLSIDELAAWATRLVNPARVASARSKVGTERTAIVDEIVLDVMIDLETVFAASWRALRGEDEAAIVSVVRGAALSIS